MYTIPELLERGKDAPQAYYGFYGDVHGMWILANNTLYFRDTETQTRIEVDLDEFRAHGQKLGRVDLTEVARLTDGDMVYRCSRTVQRQDAA